MPVRARFAATDRSIERVRSTGICARASRIRIDVSSSTLFRFVGVTNWEKRVPMAPLSNRVRSRRLASRLRRGGFRGRPFIFLRVRGWVPIVAFMRPSQRARGPLAFASARSKQARRRPRRITAMRSAIPNTSGSSDETRMTARPRCTSSRMTLYTAAFEPTSIPLVGSSRIRIFGAVCSHLASTTFC